MRNRMPLLFRCVIVCCGVFLCRFTRAQQLTTVSDSLYKIAGHKTISGHFAFLYYKSSLEADKYAAVQDYEAGNFLTVFEKKFANYFFEAAKKEQQPQLQTFSWQRYYSRCDLSAFQYYLLGMNAHINGDMWQALVTTYPYDSLKKYRQAITEFQQPLAVLFDSTYTACRKFKKLNRFHHLTLGLGKWYGKKMMLHWRKNQLQLALLYYNNTAKFNRRLHKTHRKMKRLDAFVIHTFL